MIELRSYCVTHCNLISHTLMIPIIKGIKLIIINNRYLHLISSIIKIGTTSIYFNTTIILSYIYIYLSESYNVKLNYDSYRHYSIVIIQ